MKVFSLLACVIAIVVGLSYAPSEAGVYRSKTKAACSGVAVVREYSRGRAATCSGGVSVFRSRAKATCSGGVSRARVRGCAGGY